MKHLHEINLLSLFSGIEGFGKGLEDAGFTIKKHYCSEIDKYASAVTRYNYPDAIQLGDIYNVNGSKIRKDKDEFWILTGGFPCQPYSIAGKRKGLKEKRGLVGLEMIRVISELKPQIIICENVKGILSQNKGEDFLEILLRLTEVGYILDFNLMNTRWVLPQNRERIYFIGININYLGEMLCRPHGKNGQIERLNFLKAMVQGYLLKLFHKKLNVQKKQLEINVRESELNYLNENGLHTTEIGHKGKSILLEKIIVELVLKLLPCCHIEQKVEYKESEVDLDSVIEMLQDSTARGIKSIVRDLDKIKDRPLWFIEKFIQNISGENLQKKKSSIISTLTSKTTNLKTYTCAEIDNIIGLYTILLKYFYPVLWKEIWLDLIERKDNMNYARFRNENTSVEDYSDDELLFSARNGFSNDFIGHLRGSGFGKVFPIGEDDKISINGKKGSPPNKNIISPTIMSTYYKMPTDGIYLNQIGTIGKDSEATRVYDTNGISRTIKNGGGMEAKTGLLCPAQHGRGENNEQQLEPRQDNCTNSLTSVQKDNLIVQNQRIAGWHENENVIAAHRGDKKRSTVSEHVYHKPSGILSTIQVAHQPKLINQSRIRRLTPIEALRLQGFPDSWCDKGIDENDREIEISDCQKYKMAGNAVTTEIVELIGRKLLNLSI